MRADLYTEHMEASNGVPPSARHVFGSAGRYSYLAGELPADRLGMLRSCIPSCALWLCLHSNYDDVGQSKQHGVIEVAACALASYLHVAQRSFSILLPLRLHGTQIASCQIERGSFLPMPSCAHQESSVVPAYWLLWPAVQSWRVPLVAERDYSSDCYKSWRRNESKTSRPEKSRFSRIGCRFSVFYSYKQYSIRLVLCQSQYV